uniref:Small integral membrane protein 13 n=1 Tax=Gouania willdenowi TaxID=441366 RepID=A0A8C5G2B9_GOUWI
MWHKFCIYDFVFFFTVSPPLSSGWYVVWQLFLSKFKFLRELLGDASSPSQAEPQPSESRVERTAGGVSTRTRPRTSRQSVAAPES